MIFVLTSQEKLIMVFGNLMVRTHMAVNNPTI